MKLYYFAGGCSLATHVCLREAGVEPELVRVNVETRRTEDGQPYGEVNPKGQVPAIVFDDGTMLTENVALLDWVGQRSETLRPAEGMERTRHLELLGFISTEIQKQFLALFFLPGEEAKPLLRQAIAGRFAHLGERLGHEYLLGGRFMPADAFLYVMLRWASMSQLPVPPAFDAYFDRIEARPAVQDALRAEGLAA